MGANTCILFNYTVTISDYSSKCSFKSFAYINSLNSPDISENRYCQYPQLIDEKTKKLSKVFMVAYLESHRPRIQT